MSDVAWRVRDLCDEVLLMLDGQPADRQLAALALAFVRVAKIADVNFSAQLDEFAEVARDFKQHLDSDLDHR